MKVVTYKSRGKTYWSIANDHHIPLHPLISYYLQVKLGRSSVNTRKRRAYELLFSIKYFQRRDIDVIGSIENFDFLNERDIQLFIRACKLKSHVVDDFKIESISTRSAISNLIARNHPITNIVSENTAKGRIDTFFDFYEFVWNRTYGRLSLTGKIEEKYEQCVFNFNVARGSIGSWTKCVSDPYNSHFSDDSYFELLDIINSSSHRNPFKNSKLRNEIIVKLFIETGLRRGAVAKLKISDVFNDKRPRVNTTRTPDDISDIRRERASQKTKSHTSPISKGLAKKIDYYIKNVRNYITNANSHEFVFVSEKDCRGTIGSPLSLRSYNSIFTKLEKVLGVHLTPHVLRYKWNEIFDDDINSLARELGFGSKEIEDIRKYAMGWSSNSEMANVYNNFKLLCKTRDYHLARQDEMEKLVEKRGL